jgi:hypothetical protein
MKALTVLTFKTATTLFHVVCGQVTQARCIKTGRFVKLAKAKRVFQNLLIVARKYVAALPSATKQPLNTGLYTQAKNMLDNALKFFAVSEHVQWGKSEKIRTRNLLTMLVA